MAQHRGGDVKRVKAPVALAGVALILGIAAWFDTVFAPEVMRHNGFAPSGSSAMLALASMLVAGSVLLVAVLAWRAQSVVVSVAYAIVGGFLVALPWLVWSFAAHVNDVPPALPEPLLTAISEIYYVVGGGSSNAVGTIGAAMLIGGVATVLRQRRDRAHPTRSIDGLSQAAGPTLP
jgi:hypothetical protein